MQLFTKNLISSGGVGEEAQMVQMLQGRSGTTPLEKHQVDEVKEIQATTFLNMAVCYFLTDQFEKSADKASLSIDLKPSIKAYYRRAQA